jgi:hypothetical protein
LSSYIWPGIGVLGLLDKVVHHADYNASSFVTF